jgi:hypothetical protein
VIVKKWPEEAASSKGLSSVAGLLQPRHQFNVSRAVDVDCAGCGHLHEKVFVDTRLTCGDLLA